MDDASSPYGSDIEGDDAIEMEVADEVFLEGDDIEDAHEMLEASDEDSAVWAEAEVFLEGDDVEDAHEMLEAADEDFAVRAEAEAMFLSDGEDPVDDDGDDALVYEDAFSEASGASFAGGGQAFDDHTKVAQEFNAPKLRLSASLLWELEAPLGYEELWTFGPNGPPMNVMDYCPASDCVFIVNQRSLHRLPWSELEALAQAEHRIVDRSAAQGLTLNAQANRLRCGKVGSRPSVVVADALGHVTIVPTDNANMEIAAVLRNEHADRGGGVSTWGIALAGHWEPDSDAGDVIVSANDHRVKAWTLTPERTHPSSSSSSSQRRSYQDPHVHERPWRLVTDGDAGNKPGRLLTQHLGNIPSVDLAGRRLLSAGLDGKAEVVDMASGRSEKIVGSDGLWGGCWIPLKKVRTSTDAAPRPPPEFGQITWLSGDVGVSEDILSSSVWPFLHAAFLMQTLQLVSARHAKLVRDEVVAHHRKEHLALVFAEKGLWLLDETLRVRCFQELPFCAGFAHVSYAAELSAAIMAAKMNLNGPALWAVLVQRAPRSLRYSLQVRVIPDEDHTPRRWPMVVGMTAVASGRVLTLSASRRLACHRLTIGEED